LKPFRETPRLVGLLVTLAVLGAAIFGATVAGARHHSTGPRNVAPKNHAKFAAGSKAHFRVRDHTVAARQHHVWLTISPVRRIRHGELKWNFKGPGYFAQMKRHKHGLYTWTSPSSPSPTWFMNRPGKYYWQAHHIKCGLHTPRNCDIVGRIRSFKVR
jgi:hypothetical protein